MISEETDSSHVINEHTDKAFIHFFLNSEEASLRELIFFFSIWEKIDFEKKNCEIKVKY